MSSYGGAIMDTLFKDKTILITGGTGSFGNAFLNHVRVHDCREIRILSRDELKQEEMRVRLRDSRLRFILGDVRSYESIVHSFSGVDYVFHAAALKQVPSCEFFPGQAVQTNILGSENVIKAAIAKGVKRVVC